MPPEGHPGPGPRNSPESLRGSGSHEGKLEELVERCRQSGLRRTRTLRDLLHALLDGERPMTLNELSASEYLENQCDKTTLYRILQKLAEKNIARRLGVSGRPGYFHLVSRDESDGYLICSDCGSIETIPIPDSVKALEEQLQESSGYTRLYHQFEIHGTCPFCIRRDPPPVPRGNSNT